MNRPYAPLLLHDFDDMYILCRIGGMLRNKCVSTLEQSLRYHPEYTYCLTIFLGQSFVDSLTGAVVF